MLERLKKLFHFCTWKTEAYPGEATFYMSNRKIVVNGLVSIETCNKCKRKRAWLTTLANKRKINYEAVKYLEDDIYD